MYMQNYRSTDGPNVTQGQIARNLETERLGGDSGCFELVVVLYQLNEFIMVEFCGLLLPPVGDSLYYLLVGI